MTKPANFPGRKNARRERAIERMDASVASRSPEKQIAHERVIENTERNFTAQSMAHTKKNRSARGRRRS